MYPWPLHCFVITALHASVVRRLLCTDLSSMRCSTKTHASVAILAQVFHHPGFCWGWGLGHHRLLGSNLFASQTTIIACAILQSTIANSIFVLLPDRHW
jgi:hypothetical protein